MNRPSLLKRLDAKTLPTFRRDAVDEETLTIAKSILDDIRSRGLDAVIDYAVRFGDLEKGASPIVTQNEIQQALEMLDKDTRALLERTAERIERFAQAQFKSVQPMEMKIEGGTAGHTLAAVERAGCYAPGGRFPLPSSVLMTAVTARVAGVEEIIVASPKPAQATLAAAAIAKADIFLRVGGAQAIAAMAFSAGDIPACDCIVGPGNRFVTAAKALVNGHVKIDMLAGPSELVVFADKSANPETVAFDLLAQAEHDPDAIPVLVSLDEPLIQAVDDRMAKLLETLPTAPTALKALENGFAIFADSIDQGVQLCNRIAPEHLELVLEDSQAIAPQMRHYGGLFIGQASAEVMGDYGAGPNHVLPTGATARFSGGLSVFDFLRIRTWMTLETPDNLAKDAARLARLEGLEAHALAAMQRVNSY